MIIKDIFLKPVDRDIEGVIKADDRSNLVREIQEYVVTKEIKQKLDKFIKSYLRETTSTGVWISGFFGSGKSHLLKMLSLLMENWKDGECSILESFSEKCKDDEFLVADIKKAVAIPSNSILFNIDQKADLISKQQTDVLLAVFVKVFDEHCGYYGKQGYIAKFERDLDKRGVYSIFKDEYKRVSGKEWEVGREEAILESANISLAFERATGSKEGQDKKILDKYRQDYKLAIEDFALQVWDYISTQPEDFRLNFFVDEVGQFIADNTKLMLNMQTIAESLATKCKGRAWIVVTSQEDLDAIIGEMSQSSGNDFSKILGRFKTTLNLTSANVDEVIQKRLLQKKESVFDDLAELYHNHKNSFKTMFDFVDGAQTYRVFEDREEFINCYPFIPYQFAIFQKAIKALSVNHAFQGKHRSVGERSMLGVFQQVVKDLQSKTVGNIATFDLMFDGIRSSIIGQIQKVIINAENHLQDEFAIKILKVLFMLKYVKDFRGTVANISILMMDSFDTDISALRKQVQEALFKLETQTYIQRNGEIYEYLTNEEKDIETQIKNTPVDDMSLLDKLDEILFTSGHIVKSLKIRYDDNKQDFQFTRRIDKKQYGREYEIAIQVISPYNEFYDFEDDTQIVAHSLGKSELTILLPADKRFWDDLKIAMQTEKCYAQNYNSSLKESAKKILSEKKDLNKDRLVSVKNRLAGLVCAAKLYLSGEPIDEDQDAKVTDANQRICNAFQLLISKVYPYLKMLGGISYTEQDIGRCLDNSQIVADYTLSLSEAEQEVFSYINTQARESKKSTVQDVIDKFSKKPYGWGLYAILCQLARLYAKARIEVFGDATSLENSALEKALKNTQKHCSLVIQTLQEYTPSQLRRLKELSQTLFNKPAAETEAKALAKEISTRMQELVLKLEALVVQKDMYPFLSSLEPVIVLLKKAVGKHHSWYYTEFLSQEDKYTGAKIELIDPIQAFWNSGQKSIYDEISRFIREQEPNFSYLDSVKLKELLDGFADLEIYNGNRIQQLKIKYDILKDKLDRLIDDEKSEASLIIEQSHSEINHDPDFIAAESGVRDEVIGVFERAKTRIVETSIIAVIKDILNRFNEVDYPEIIRSIHTKKDEGVPEKPRRKVQIKSIKISYSSDEISSEAELRSYMQSLSQALLRVIRKGNIIKLEEDK
ncbi:MAG TPA: BREX system P-loop protein BrxC [Rectinema sp.]|mgnify:FL=1|nr:BREX system P-loop protein BrxC [Rectinema sp.]